ncbi:metal ABC transporter substrate-binding protein [Pseudothauera nasutitermitis]|uniref:Metal ABC transporter substrate-binding protein n=1 Tax=Pseudothauera nasutitermitis TaxID=2565930 RepID=A0A4V3WC84_9RHOO|nr:zinc ABC transporter substrate-binding protein [Pseudothauera nasutitermitis]THF66148.1 metal ABC transporter substrate-binding protein [Pseudothauera nasutitermitis]
MKTVNILFVALGLLAGASASAAAAGTPAVRVLTAHPVAHAITARLAEGGAIEITRVVPATLPPTRHASFLGGRGAGAFEAAARQADAVVGLRSVWADDVLYPHARRANVRVVEVDAARPVDGALPGVALRSGEADGLYAWLDPTNLGRMADVVARDLGRLSPADAEGIAGRLATFKRAVVELAAGAGRRFAQADNPVVFTLSERLDYFVTGFNLELAGRDVREDEAWTDEAAAQLGERLRAEGIGVVLHHRALTPALDAAVRAAGAVPVLIPAEGNDPLEELRNAVESVAEALNAP